MNSIHPFRARTLVLHSLGMEQPLLWAEDKLDQAKELVLPTSRCHRPITTDIGEVNRSDQTQGGSSVEEPCQTQWVRAERKHHTCAADGFAPYDPAKKRKDNIIIPSCCVAFERSQRSSEKTFQLMHMQRYRRHVWGMRLDMKWRQPIASA